MSDESVMLARLDLAIERAGERIAELEAGLRNVAEVAAAGTVTIGKLESALRDAEKALEIVTSADGDFERTQFELCGCEEVQAWMGLCKRRKRLAREALTAIRAALHGEGK